MGLFSNLFGTKKVSEPTQDGFATEFMQALAERGVRDPLEYVTEEFCLRINAADGTSHRIYLTNSFQDYRAARPEERLNVLQRYVAAAMESRRATSSGERERFEDIADRLVPLVRPRQMLEMLRLQLVLQNPGEVEAVFPGTPLGEHLTLGLAIDYENSLAQVNSKAFGDWGVSFEQALDRAKANLTKKSSDTWDIAHPGVYVSPWRDTYDGCRVAIPELIKRLSVKGDPVVLLPTRICAIVTGSEDEQGLKVALSVAEKALQTDRRISMIPLRFTGGSWNSFEPERAFPALARYRRERILERLETYSTQKELLEALNEREGEDVFVASYQVFGNDQEIAMALGTWSEDVATWLPESEMISFVRGSSGQVCVVPWDKVLTSAGHRLKRLEHFPPRYATDGFPSDDEFKAMNAEWSTLSG